MPSASETRSRTLTFVVGSGRSGTSTLSVSLQTLGMHVPQPEVEPDDTNPRGFGEAQWVVDLHNRLLREVNVQTSDARPSAWLDVGTLALKEKPRAEVYQWLDRQFKAGGSELVIKDPRIAWFLGLWKSAALHCDARPVYLTMLRPVTEVVGSKKQYYTSTLFGELNRVAGWINMMLHTERATRGGERAFIRYEDLLSDWTVPVYAIGERFGLKAITDASANDIRRVHSFVDPGLRRVQTTWDEMDVPRPLREIADETWKALSMLADDRSGDADNATLHKTFDDLRAEYTHLYGESEAIAQSSIVAANRAGSSKVRNKQRGSRGRRGKRGSTKVVDRLARRVPHSVRARIPPGARRRVKNVLGRFIRPKK